MFIGPKLGLPSCCLLFQVCFSGARSSGKEHTCGAVSLDRGARCGRRKLVGISSELPKKPRAEGPPPKAWGAPPYMSSSVCSSSSSCRRSELLTSLGKEPDIEMFTRDVDSTLAFEFSHLFLPDSLSLTHTHTHSLSRACARTLNTF